MTEMNIEEIIAAAPPGVIMSGTVDVHKVVHAGKTHIIMIGKIGETEFRKELQPAILRALAGRGPMGKILGKMFGSAETITGPEKTDG